MTFKKALVSFAVAGLALAPLAAGATEAGITNSTTTTVTSGNLTSQQNTIENYNGVQLDHSWASNSTKTESGGVWKPGTPAINNSFGAVGCILVRDCDIIVAATPGQYVGGTVSKSSSGSTSDKTTYFSGQNTSQQNFSGTQNSTTVTTSVSSFTNF